MPHFQRRILDRRAAANPGVAHYYIDMAKVLYRSLEGLDDLLFIDYIAKNWEYLMRAADLTNFFSRSTEAIFIFGKYGN
jgi:hypothetical protein